jgi:phosphohistidine swiveling domain-containing protein
MKREKWHIFEWPGYHLYQALPPMKAWVFDFPKFSCPLSKMAVTYAKGTTCFCFIKSEFEEHGNNLFNRIKKRPEIMFKVLKQVDLAADEIFKLGKKWDKINFTKLSNKELLKYHKELFYWDEKLWRSGQIQNLLEFDNNYLSEYIRNLIKDKFGQAKVIEYFSALSTAKYETMSEKQDKDFVKLLANTKNIDKKSNKFLSLVNKHAKKYTWMIYGWAGPALDEEYFLNNLLVGFKNIGAVTNLKNKSAAKQKIIKKQTEIINKFSAKDQKLILLLRFLLEAKAKRVDAHSLTYFLGDKIRAEIAKRNYLSLNQTRVISVEDTQKFFSKSPDINELNEEYNFTIFWYENKKPIIKLSGKAGLKKYQYIVSRLPKFKNTDKIKEIKGELAYSGKVRGEVSLVLSAEDFKKFKPGEILVTRVTDPSYVPIMKVAKAVITDVGGITCHAAIVSRELKKPCLIGTKIATQVLKDGDLVEVDADKGIVKILNKK